MSIGWTDTIDIAIELYETHPDVDPRLVRFTDLMEWVMALPDFEDYPKPCGAKVLQAIQAAWIYELD